MDCSVLITWKDGKDIKDAIWFHFENERKQNGISKYLTSSTSTSCIKDYCFDRAERYVRDSA